MGKSTVLKRTRGTVRKTNSGKAELENMLVRMALDKLRKDIHRILRSGPLDMADWAAVTHVQPRTLSVRLREERDFPPLEQDRILLVDQVMTRGKEVFGDKARFKRWLESPRAPLGDRTPKELLVTNEGIGLVMAELGRIEHGVF